MRTIYFDLSMGAAGDMLTAALLELHPEPERVLETLNRVFQGRVSLSAARDRKCGIAGTHVTVTADGKVEGEKTRSEGHEEAHAEQRHDCLCRDSSREHGGHHAVPHSHGHHSHTSVSEVREFIRELELPEPVLRDALGVYDLLAEAEARVHGSTLENIHFHEVGTLDAMADVVSVCCLMRELAPEKICASPVHVGSGTVRCAHGELPVPAPATLELLKGIPFYSAEIRGELCTPTGAALLRYYVKYFGDMPGMKVDRVGYGLGTKDFPRANLLRVLLGETEAEREQLIELVCNLDDMTGEELAYAQERLFAAGALDVYFTNIGMKKSRPAVMLTCMCRQEQRDEMLRCLFRNTTSLGVREYVCSRYTLARSFSTRETPCGSVRMKRAEGYGTVREKPEFEDLKRIAEKENLPLREAARMAEEAIPDNPK
ncbi:MAG: nickel pincer cofactor biosynthesis protein LarC [Oscillospiraceae bacterium]|nr:nickel pincer cofactor biosynthesis protein LarC [Oscillospiraceae bacterium]